jgi:hypothetical protein
MSEAKIASAEILFEQKQNEMIEIQKQLAEYDDFTSPDVKLNPFDYFAVKRENLKKETKRKRELKESTKNEIKAIIVSGIS